MPSLRPQHAPRVNLHGASDGQQASQDRNYCDGGGQLHNVAASGLNSSWKIRFAGKLKHCSKEDAQDSHKHCLLKNHAVNAPCLRAQQFQYCDLFNFVERECVRDQSNDHSCNYEQDQAEQ